MERLSAQDLRAVLELAVQLAEVDGVEAFRGRLLAGLRGLVACDIASWNLISPLRREATISAVDPSDCRAADGDEELLGAYAHQNPLVAAAAAGQVRRFSDFISLRELHGLDIYDAIYRPRDVERQIAFVLPAPDATVLGIALSRARPDFSERERRILEVAAPIVSGSYARVLALTTARARLGALERAIDEEPTAIILVNSRGRIEFATASAVAWLQALTGDGEVADVPEPLRSWCRLQRASSLGNRSLVVGGWIARFAPGEDQLDAIVLEPPGRLNAPALRAAGLTARETAVLALVAEGMGNAQIARKLDVSERTVAKHLEHVYSKLRVGSRTAAVARARSRARA